MENKCPLTRTVGDPLVLTESPSSTTRTEYIDTEGRKKGNEGGGEGKESSKNECEK